ncbi:MAG: DUF1223 domain-containing protein [Yoonia sp.]|nr:DUF1223 domain-containing protein [Yoonia sp.]
MRHFLTALAFWGAIGVTPVAAQDNKVVVELYTSQGCSSCPPADALLHDLAGRSDVIALALHVDYWDYLGWKDNFGRPAFTARQHAYARAANATTVYTPQMVIGGKDHVIGSKAMEIMDRVAQHRNVADLIAITLTRNGDAVLINAQSNAGLLGNLIVQVVRYTPEETVAIKRGENAGKTISYSNIVYRWDSVGRWDGSHPLAITASAAGADPVVVIIQADQHGPILAAAEIR